MNIMKANKLEKKKMSIIPSKKSVQERIEVPFEIIMNINPLKSR